MDSFCRAPLRECRVAVNRLGRSGGSVSWYSSASRGPPFYGNESGNGAFPFYNHPQGYGLHPAGGQPQLDLEPQQGADFVSHQAVQDAAGLLGVDQFHINWAGVGKGFLDRLFGDFVKDDPLGRFVFQLVPAGGGLQVPGDGFAFPVGVGGQENVGGLVAGGFQVGDQIFLVAQRQVFGREFLLGIDAQG